MGTAIHAEIEKALEDNPDVLIETSVEYNGMKAHIDCYVPGTGDVIDWKTSKVKNLSYFPTTQQRWQVQTYGYLLAKNGFDVKRVSLVAIARDGDERDIKVHTEDYDETVALQALNWLKQSRVQNRHQIQSGMLVTASSIVSSTMHQVRWDALV